MTDTYLQTPTTPLGHQIAQWVSRFKGDIDDLNLLSRQRAISVTRYGAKSDGVTDDSGAILAAIADAAGTGGSVFLPPLPHLCTQQILIPSNVSLYGVRGLSKIRCAVGDGAWGVAVNGSSQVQISDLVIEGWGSSTINQALLAIQNSTDVHLSNVHILGGTNGRVGCVIRSGCRQVRVDGLTIKNITYTHGSTANGVGLWVFQDIRDCQFDQVLVDTVDGVGILLDAGTTDGLGVEVADNVFTNTTVRNATQTAGGFSMGGIALEGAHHNVFAGFLIDGVPQYVGLHLGCDQTTVAGQVPSSDENVFSGGIIRMCGDAAIQVDGGSRNQFSNILMQDFQTLFGDGASAIVLASTSGTNGVFSANDNRFIACRAVQESAYAAGYLDAVALEAADTAAAGTVLRNRFVHCDWGSSAANGIGSGGPANGFFVQAVPTGGRDAATVAPITGPNANWSDLWGLDGSHAGQGLFFGFNRAAGFYANGDVATMSLAADGDLFFDFANVHALRVNPGFVVPYPDNAVSLGLSGNRWSNLYAEGDVQIGGASPATNTTTGLVWIPSMAGAPVGAPTARTGRVAMVWDETDHKLYIWNGTAWRATAALT